MRITILTFGTRGDTQPFISLAASLKERGHDVTLGARPDFEETVKQYGIDFAPLGLPVKEFFDNNAKNYEKGNFFKIAFQGIVKRRMLFENMGEDAYSAAVGSDAIIFHYMWHAGYSIAEKLQIPCAGAMLFPITPTKEFPCYMIGHGKDRGKILNSLTWWVSDQLITWQYQRGYDNKLRKDLGLTRSPFFGYYRKWEKEKMPVYYAYSFFVQPKPSDWSERIKVTGVWKSPLPENWEPSEELAKFLADGEPPVYIGFGSTPLTGKTLSIVLEALELSGKRGVLLSGWAGLGDGANLPDNVICVKDVPHTWLFPQMACVVHHGGAGTTAAGLLSGIPTIIIPSTIDQHSWGRRVYELGVGPEPIPFRSLTAQKLANAIIAATSDERMKEHARQASEVLATEDGLQQTVDSFLMHVNGESGVQEENELAY